MHQQQLLLPSTSSQLIPIINNITHNNRPSINSFTPRRPARPITKCDRCRSRKSRCDSGHPCEACLKSKAVCEYTNGRPTKGPEGSLPINSYPNVSNQLITSTVSLEEDRQNLMEKIDKLQRLLNDVTARQAMQAYELNFSLQNRNPCSSYDTGFGIDLETDNLITHFSKLWLRKEPDQSFFKPLILH